MIFRLNRTRIVTPGPGVEDGTGALAKSAFRLTGAAPMTSEM